MRGLFKTGGAAGKAATADGGRPTTRRRRLALFEEFERSGIGWFWASDAEGSMIYLLGERRAALGKPVERDRRRAARLRCSYPTSDEDAERTARTLPFLLARATRSTSSWFACGDGRARSLVVDHRAARISTPTASSSGYRGSAKDVTSSLPAAEATPRASRSTIC